MRTCIIAIAFIMVSSSCSFKNEEGVNYGLSPVLFVHGYGGFAQDSWGKIISYLEKAGYPRVYLRAIQLNPNTGSNIRAAEKEIAPAVEVFLMDVNRYLKRKAPQELAKTKINLVSHSMGGLSARWYAAKVMPERVNIWLSLGGANHGSNALCGPSDPGAKDCCPAFARGEKESHIQYALNGVGDKADVDETPYGVGKDSRGVKSILPDKNCRISYFSIRTFPDRWIKPEKSAILDGAGGVSLSIPKIIAAKMTSEGNILMENGVGHDEMLGDSAVMGLVGIILKMRGNF